MPAPHGPGAEHRRPGVPRRVAPLRWGREHVGEEQVTAGPSDSLDSWGTREQRPRPGECRFDGQDGRGSQCLDDAGRRRKPPGGGRRSCAGIPRTRLGRDDGTGSSQHTPERSPEFASSRPRRSRPQRRPPSIRRSTIPSSMAGFNTDRLARCHECERGLPSGEPRQPHGTAGAREQIKVHFREIRAGDRPPRSDSGRRARSRHPRRASRRGMPRPPAWCRPRAREHSSQHRFGRRPVEFAHVGAGDKFRPAPRARLRERRGRRRVLRPPRGKRREPAAKAH